MAQLISSPIIGKLSDLFGRKPLLIISQISTTIGFIVLGIADTVFLLILARLIDGLFGSNMTLAQSILSDITPNHEKTRVFGYSSAVFGAGIIFGPAIGGILADISFGLPMFLAAGVSLVSIFLIVSILPETRPRKKGSFQLRITDVLPILEIKDFIKSRIVIVSLGMLLLYNFAFQAFISNFALFFEAIINAKPSDVGFLLAWLGVLRVIMQSTMIAPLIKKIGEDKTLLSGIVLMVFTMISLIVTNNFWFALLPMSFLAYGTGVSRPILTSKLTNSVPQNQTGTILGVNNSLVSLSQIITPSLGGFILEYGKSAYLAELSALTYMALLVFWYANRRFVVQPSQTTSTMPV